MRTYLLLMSAIYLFFPMSARSQELDFKVKGGYKSCVVYGYYFSSGEIDDNSKRKAFMIEYDNNGNRISMMDYQSTLYSSLSDTKFVFTYDKNGNLIETADYNSKGSITGRVKSKYDVKGKEISRKRITSGNFTEWTETFVYDDNGRKTETIKRKSNGSISLKNKFTYDDKGNITEINGYDSKGNYVISETFGYDEKGNVVEYKRFNDRLTLERYIFGYNEEGNRVQSIWYSDNSGKPMGMREYIYSK